MQSIIGRRWRIGREVATGIATIISSDGGTRDWCAALLVVKVVLFPGNGQE
jgi:hypothetical protein